MATDVQIARQYTARPISEIAAKLGVAEEDLLPYGREIAKVDVAALARPRQREQQKLQEWVLRLVLSCPLDPGVAASILVMDRPTQASRAVRMQSS